MSNTNGNLAEWLTESAAAARIGVSERTLRRMVQNQVGPERKERPREGNRPEPVYNPEDVEKIAAKRNPAPAFASESPIGQGLAKRNDLTRLAKPGAPAAAVPGSTAITLPPADPRTLATFAELIVDQILAKRPPETAQASQFAWMTIQEASDYTKLSQAFLTRLVYAGILPYVYDGFIKVRRPDLDGLATRKDVARLTKLGRELQGVTKEIRGALAARKEK